MANLREATAISMEAANLGGRADGGESHADRIGALAMSDRLAALLWHLKYGNDRRTFKPAVLLLSHRVHVYAKKKHWRHAGPDVIDRMCEQVLREWLADFCQDCKGTGITGNELSHNTIRRACSVCTGEGFMLGNRFCHYPRAGEISEGAVRRKCNACSGNGYTLIEPTNKPSKMGLCSTCKGQPRIRKIDWGSRVRALGIPQESYAKWESRFDMVMDILNVADRKCNVTMNIQLERLENC